MYHTCLSIGWKQGVPQAYARGRGRERHDLETLELLAFPKLALVHVRTEKARTAPWMMAVNASGSASNRLNIHGDDQFVAERIGLLWPVEGDRSGHTLLHSRCAVQSRRQACCRRSP